MATTIWKVALGPGMVAYDLPKGAHVLSAAMQLGAPQMWFMCDPEQPREKRYLFLTGTGHEFPEHGGTLHFISTMLTEDQAFVFHLFEAKDTVL